MIVISRDVVLNTPVADANAPQIGYDNVIDSDIISTQDDQVFFPASNLANPNTDFSSSWRSTPLIETIIEIDLTEFSNQVDYIGIANHNWGTLDCNIELQGDVGAGTVNVIPGFSLDNDDPLMLRFEAAAYIKLEIVLTSGTPQETGPPLEFRASVIYAGLVLAVERNLYVDHVPITYGRDFNVDTGFSGGGNYLGRIVIGEGRSSTVELSNLTASWYRIHLDPFIRAAQVTPFFWAWRPATYPLETGYCWVTNQPRPTNQRPNGMMQLSMDIRGVA